MIYLAIVAPQVAALLAIALALCARRLAVAEVRADTFERQLAESKGREAYWRTRAEKILDQQGLRSGNLSAPVMTEPQVRTDPMRSLFGGLGVTEINRSPTDDSRPSGISGVDAAKAAEAVAALLK